MRELKALPVNDLIRQTVRDAFEAFNAHDLDRWMRFYAEDALHYQPDREQPLRGINEIREDYLVSTWIPFPDFEFDLERAFSENEWVCVQGIFTGTHSGPLAGSDGETIPPTNRRVRAQLCMVVRLENGRAAEVYEYHDEFGFLKQLGLIT